MDGSRSLTESDIRQLASDQSFDRGYAYFESGAVFDVTLRGNVLRARVHGSGYEPYRVEVTLAEAGVAQAWCTCPYDWGGICKHSVAVLLVWVHQREEIKEKPALETLLAELTAEQLRQVLLDIAALNPEIADAIEHQVEHLEAVPADPADSAARAMAVDLHAVRREIQKDFRLAGKGDPFEYGYYDEDAALEMYPEEILQPHLEKVTALLDAGDVDTAVDLISTIIDSFIEGLEQLEEYIYEYNEDVFVEANLVLGAALAEVLLSLSLDEGEQEEWLEQIDLWESSLGDLDIARTAVEQAWSYPPLVAAMEGHITEQGAWEGESPYYADELALVRLQILARQGRQEEYIQLATAEGQTQLAVTMLAQSGQVDKAVAEARQYLTTPSQILAVSMALADQGALEAALDLARHGLTLEETSGLTGLARWTRDQAGAAGRQPLALQAAQTAFSQEITLANYTAVQQLADEQWPSIRPALLASLQQKGHLSNVIDIYLHENMLSEAMKAVDKSGVFFSDVDLRRVVEATRDTAPDWGIGKYQQIAEAIMNGGKANAYDAAAAWLERARDIYRQHNRLPQWQRYLDKILEVHQRKYKLFPLLKKLR